MLAEFKRQRVLALGAWNIDGAEYRYLDLYDPTGRDSQTVRFGIAKDVEELHLGFGDEVDLVCEISNEQKVVKGTDRVIARCKVVIQSVAQADQAHNGHRPHREHAAVAEPVAA